MQMKRLVDAETRQAIAAAVADVEGQTSAELVTVLAPASASYGEYALLWSAVLTLLATTVALFLGPASLPPLAWSVLPLAVPALFMALSLVFRLPVVLRRLVPRHVQRRNAAAMAHVQFLAQHLHHTRDETGVLLFVSEFERYVEILVDRGVSRHVADNEWQRLVDTFTAQVARGAVREGFLAAITGCGQLLAAKLPPRPDNPNELPNRLAVID